MSTAASPSSATTRIGMSTAIFPIQHLIATIIPAIDPSIQERHEGLFDFLRGVEQRPLLLAPPGNSRTDDNNITKTDDTHYDPGANADVDVMETSPDTADNYLALPKELETQMETKRIVIRKCYNHLLPRVLTALSEGERVTITGTPGIGKSLFGFVLLRALLVPPKTTPPFHTAVYWDEEAVTAISLSERRKQIYGLNQEYQLDSGTKIFVGSWSVSEDPLKTFANFLVDAEVAKIHDPAAGDLYGGTKRNAAATAIIVSFGHELHAKWNNKSGMPKVNLCMPTFTKTEIWNNRDNLFVDRPKEWVKQLNDCGDSTTSTLFERLFDQFGGSIRHWGRETEESAWEEMKAKVREVVQKDKSSIATRTVNHRGSIVHIHVDFDSTKPMYPLDGFNDFDHKRTHYVLASAKIMEEFSTEYQDQSAQEWKKLMLTFEGEKGAEAVYGFFFEKYVHHLLCESTTELNIRVARRDGKNKAAFAATKISVKRIETFAGRDPSYLTDVFGAGSLDVGTYLRLESARFPTYEAIAVVSGDVVGLAPNLKVSLLLQMTVSGASGLPRSPKHSMKKHVRLQLDAALRKIVKDFTDTDICVSAFCVPTVCFHPFLFQFEELKNSNKYDSKQPDYQFVIEIPVFFRSLETDRRSPLNEIHGTTGRMHRYEIRSDKDTKRQKVEDLHK